MKAGQQAAITADQLLVLLQQQREALLRTDPVAVADLESSTRNVEQALATLAGLAQQGPNALAAFEPAAIVRLQRELQGNQTMLAALASGNRRALNALFGEPSLYCK